MFIVSRSPRVVHHRSRQPRADVFPKRGSTEFRPGYRAASPSFHPPSSRLLLPLGHPVQPLSSSPVRWSDPPDSAWSTAGPVGHYFHLPVELPFAAQDSPS